MLLLVKLIDHLLLLLRLLLLLLLHEIVRLMLLLHDLVVPGKLRLLLLDYCRLLERTNSWTCQRLVDWQLRRQMSKELLLHVITTKRQIRLTDFSQNDEFALSFSPAAQTVAAAGGKNPARFVERLPQTPSYPPSPFCCCSLYLDGAITPAYPRKTADLHSYYLLLVGDFLRVLGKKNLIQDKPVGNRLSQCNLLALTVLLLLLLPLQRLGRRRRGRRRRCRPQDFPEPPLRRPRSSQASWVFFFFSSVRPPKRD